MTVNLRINNQLLADYLRYLFPPVDSVLKVNSEHGMGKLLIAHCRVSSKPVPEVCDGSMVTLRLPLCNATQSLEYKFLYYSNADTVQLNLALKAYFDLDFEGYYRRGENADFSKRDIVEGFIQSRKLISSDSFDALHKRAYRKQLERHSILLRKLQRKAYYIDESLDTSGLKK